MATACTQGKRTQHGKPQGVVRDDQLDAREGQAGRPGVAERFAVLLKPGNAGRRKGPPVQTDATVVRDLEIGQPINSENRSETAEALHAKAKAEPSINSDTILACALRTVTDRTGLSFPPMATPKACRRFRCEILRIPRISMDLIGPLARVRNNARNSRRHFPVPPTPTKAVLGPRR